MSEALTPIPSKTVRRARDEGRLVVTFECRVDPDRMDQSPTWQRDATDVLRALLATLTFDALVKYLRHQGIDVIGTTMEVGK